MQLPVSSTLVAPTTRKPLAFGNTSSQFSAVTSTSNRPWQSGSLVQRLLQLVTVDPSLRRTYAYSRRLLRGQPASEQVVAAANLFLIRGLYEEATAILLHYGLTDQAAKALLQQGQPERAGLLYAHAGQWERAAFCFGQARLWQKAANCCVCGRDFATAAAYFVRAGALTEAAQACVKGGDLAGAFHHFGAAGDLTAAAGIIKRWRQLEPSESIQSKLTPAGHELLAKLSAQATPHRGQAQGDGRGEAAAATQRLAPEPARFAVSSLTEMLPQDQQLPVLHAEDQAPSGDLSLLTRPGILQLDPEPDGDGDGSEYRPSWLEAPTQVGRLGGGKLDVAEFFQRFTRSDRDKLWRLGRVIECREGEVIVDFDDEPPGLYTVLDGHLDIYRDRSDVQPTPADQIGARVSFGQFWAVMRLRSQVRVTARRACRIHMISRRDLVKALRLNDQTHQALRRVFMSGLLEHLTANILIKNM